MSDVGDWQGDKESMESYLVLDLKINDFDTFSQYIEKSPSSFVSIVANTLYKE